jgi:ubiquinone/menaquinone biosynthesis C-methylase UbiE
MTKDTHIQERVYQSNFPKVLPPLTDEQQKISDDFIKHWHEVLPARFGIINKFNHQYVVKNAPKKFLKTIEVGAGDGEHLKYEKLSASQIKNYYSIDIRQNMISALQEKFPEVNSFVADCQTKLAFEDNYFDRVLAIHVLEHLPNLPEAIKEVYRICNKKTGIFSVVIPCEGSLAYSLARKISAQRIFEKRYKQSYKWLIEREHLNIPSEIFEELKKYFHILKSTYFPIPIQVEMCNLCIGLTLKPK